MQDDKNSNDYLCTVFTPQLSITGIDEVQPASPTVAHSPSSAPRNPTGRRRRGRLLQQTTTSNATDINAAFVQITVQIATTQAKAPDLQVELVSKLNTDFTPRLQAAGLDVQTIKLQSIVVVPVSGGLSSTAIGLVVGLLVPLALGAVVAGFIVLRYKRQRQARRNQMSAKYDASAWNINFSELEFSRLVGEGSFGRVYLGKWRETTVAIKMLLQRDAPGANDRMVKLTAPLCGDPAIDAIPVKDMDAAARKATLTLLAELHREAGLMATMRHPNVVMFMGVCAEPPCMVAEYCARGSVYDVYKHATESPAAAGELGWARRLKMALGAAKGMFYLHTRTPPVIHRDLKSANLLVDKHWHVKVADFNLSRVMHATAVVTSIAATNPRWLAPEVLAGHGYNRAADVYAFGIILFELLTWRVPWEEMSTWQVVIAVIERKVRPQLPPPDQLPGGGSTADLGPYVALMDECWAHDPERRPTFERIILLLRQMIDAQPGDAATGNGTRATFQGNSSDATTSSSTDATTSTTLTSLPLSSRQPSMPELRSLIHSASGVGYEPSTATDPGQVSPANGSSLYGVSVNPAVAKAANAGGDEAGVFPAAAVGVPFATTHQAGRRPDALAGPSHPSQRDALARAASAGHGVQDDVTGGYRPHRPDVAMLVPGLTPYYEDAPGNSSAGPDALNALDTLAAALAEAEGMRSPFASGERSSIDTPWVGVGPSTSRALAFVASEGKTLPSGMCEASAAVRYLDVTLCPVSSFADLCVAEFSNAARLRVEHLEKAFVLRAPSGLGHSVLSATTFTKQIGACLRAAGVQCDLSEKGASGKATVTHQCKKFAVAQAALVNVDYNKITHIASHEQNVTKQHYMTICHDALHRMAGCLCRICQPRLRCEVRDSFSLAGLLTVEQALALFRIVDATPATMGEVGALASLEAEREKLKLSAVHTQLQKLASLYLKKHKGQK
ncbi:hypothetical protein WJX72_008890 [[Myrmecia] bisecta]|uniref:Protein kinase domain-containing protein n=1 Tax=[Myrmecia] bisecta TaxID=41462 RepID=A0AAW1PTL9_9CHLO